MPLGERKEKVRAVRPDDATTERPATPPDHPPPLAPAGRTHHVRGGEVAPTFASLRAKLRAEGSRNVDHLIKVDHLLFTEEGMLTRDISKVPSAERGEKLGDFGLLSWQDHAWSQFCSLLELPGDYIRRCPNGFGPASKKANVDYWKEQAKGKTFLIRARKLDTPDEKTKATGYARAVLTDKYARFDHLELLDVVEPIAAERGLIIESCQVTDKNMNLRILDPKPITVGTLPGGAPDVHKFGVIILNSEVGASPIRVDFLDYRQVCANGATVLFGKKPLFSHKHVGIELHEIRTGILGALDRMQEKTEIMVQAIKGAQDTPVKDATREIHRILTQNRASDDFVKAVLAAYDLEPVATRYGVVQAITRAAQNLDGDRRREMEELGGRLLLQG